MIERPLDREDALDIVWAVIRNDCERWLASWPNYVGTAVSYVINETGWPQTYVYNCIYELTDLGQLTKRWSHAHQTYWSSHYHTLNETPIWRPPEKRFDYEHIGE